MQDLFAWVGGTTNLPTYLQAALFVSAAAAGIAVFLAVRMRLRGTQGKVEAIDAGADPARTITEAVRGLRIRYVAVIAVISVLGILFVAGSHRANARFSNATSMAVLVAKASETTERTARVALAMSGEAVANGGWMEQAIEVHAGNLRKIIDEMKLLWSRLDDDLKSRLRVESANGNGDAISILDEFQAQVADAAKGNAADRVTAGKYIDGTIGFLVQPALAQQAQALREFNRQAADRVKLTINVVGAVLAVFATAILVLIFLPMERSIRVALAKLKTAIEGAKIADRAKSEFLANMSHEIRTPMNGVLGMAELMAHTELDARQKTYNDVIVKSGYALLTIINDILDFSKIDAGHTELDPAPFDLHEAVEDVATLVSSRVVEKDLELIVRVDAELPAWIVGDVGRVRQILTNLAGNAVKFTERGHVLIEVARAGGDILFKVTDTGIGIPEDKLASVFEKFSQVDASSTRRHEGTGLGLAIASRLVELMAGSIGATSKPGAGSTFHFQFPLVPHEGVDETVRVAADVAGSRILVVDDNNINRDILIDLARKWGFDACAVESGRMALELLDHAAAVGVPVDLVVLDYQMPEMNGAEVLSAIRGRPAIAATPVVLLTSVDHRIAVRELKSAGANAILTKPTRSALLLTTITDELRTRHGRAVITGENPRPHAPLQNVKAPPAFRQAANSGAGEALDILVAEDNEVNQLVFSQILLGLDYSFEIVGDGRRAVETWNLRRPRLILMDVSMPEMNGLDATRHIRNAEKAHGLPRTPIMGVTAHALKDDRERCLAAGMDDYMTKPISPGQLQSKLAEWLTDAVAKRA
jgi:signal transduction histidine kinase/DNA-binding response OmpR family regulator